MPEVINDGKNLKGTIERKSEPVKKNCINIIFAIAIILMITGCTHFALNPAKKDVTALKQQVKIEI